jgi:hypothetical protein
LQTLGAHPIGVPTDRQQAHQVAGVAQQAQPLTAVQGAHHRAAAHQAHGAHPPRRIGEQQQVRQLVVQPFPAQRAEHHDLVGPRGEGAVECQLCVRRVLVDRMPFDGDALGRETRDEIRFDRVQVPDQEMRAHAHRVEPVSAAIGGHDQAGIAEMNGVTGIGLAVGNDDRLHVNVLPSLV